MDEASVLAKMQTVIDLVASDIGTIRTGRVTPGLVEGVVIPAYGGTQKLKLNELASISSSDPQTLVISPWDKSIIGEIRQGLLAANIGVSPVIDGEVVRISFPPMTTEDRERFVKLLSVKLENGRVMIRQVRADTLHAIKKAFEEKEVTEDEKFAAEKRLQELTDKFTGEINERGTKKKEELSGHSA